MGRGPARHPYPKGILRPNAWVYKDPFDHARHKPFLRARAQANFRAEEWLLTFEDWCSFWSTEDLWACRGRGRHDLCLSRIDFDGAWAVNNCEIVERIHQLNKQKSRNIGKKYKTRKRNV